MNGFTLRAASPLFIMMFSSKASRWRRKWVLPLALYQTLIGPPPLLRLQSVCNLWRELVSDLTVSSDLYHCDEVLSEKSQNAIVAARWLKIPTGMISIAKPDKDAAQTHGQVKDQDAVMFRGRAAAQLAPRAEQYPWNDFTQCRHEDLREPGRIHLDPFGNLHICQGIVIANVFEKPLTEFCKSYDADAHPICGPLLEGGPAALVREYNLPHKSTYADACHLCYEARCLLRARFPEWLKPDQVYGEVL